MGRKPQILKQPWVKIALVLAGVHLGKDEHRIMSVAEVAEHLGYSKQAAYDWIERGNMKHVRHETVKQLAELAGVPMEFLTE